MRAFDHWTCHICGKDRPDSCIGVMSYPMKGLPGATINARYCTDNPNCRKEALEWKDKREFPCKPERRTKKKWWQFWK